MDVTPIDSVLKGRPSIVVPGGQLSMPLPPKNLEEKKLTVLPNMYRHRQINPHIVHIQIKVTQKKISLTTLFRARRLPCAKPLPD